jgi:hypothetical protein
MRNGIFSGCLAIVSWAADAGGAVMLKLSEEVMRVDTEGL